MAKDKSSSVRESEAMTSKVRKQILAIRDTGETNMFDVTTVVQIAVREGFYELVDYLLNNKREYGNFILTGKCRKEDDHRA